MVFLETLQAFLSHLFLTYFLVHGFKLSSLYVFLGAAAPVFMIVLRIALITSVAVVATSVRGGSNLTHHPSLFFFLWYLLVLLQECFMSSLLPSF